MKYLFCFSLLLLLGTNAFSQYYTRDAGLLIKEGGFLTYRQFFNEELAFEGQVGFSGDGFRITGLREYFRPLTRVQSENIRMLYGYGLHVGLDYETNYKVFRKVYSHAGMWNPKFGFDGIIGFDIAASEVPLIITAAMQPYFEFSLNQYFKLEPFNFVVAFKYRF